MNSWLVALREWNNSKGGAYTVPKKGTSEYAEVKQLTEKAKEDAMNAKWDAAAEKKAEKMKATAARREAKTNAKKEASTLAKARRVVESTVRKVKQEKAMKKAKASF